MFVTQVTSVITELTPASGVSIHITWTPFPCLLKHEFSTTIRILAFAFIGTFLFLHPGHTADIIGYLKTAWTGGPRTMLRDVITRKTAISNNVSKVGKEVLFVLWSCFLFNYSVSGNKVALPYWKRMDSDSDAITRYLVKIRQRYGACEAVDTTVIGSRTCRET